MVKIFIQSPGWRVEFRDKWSKEIPWKVFNNVGGMVSSHKTKKEANRNIPLIEVKI